MPSRQKLIVPPVCALTIPSEKYHKKFSGLILILNYGTIVNVIYLKLY